MMARICGISRAAAPPWTTRAATRKPALGASPQAAEATVNSAEAEDVHFPPAVRVAEPARGDQPGGHREAVAGHDELDQRRSRVQVALGVRQRHVDDEEVEQ